MQNSTYKDERLHEDHWSIVLSPQHLAMFGQSLQVAFPFGMRHGGTEADAPLPEGASAHSDMPGDDSKEAPIAVQADERVALDMVTGMLLLVASAADEVVQVRVRRGEGPEQVRQLYHRDGLLVEQQDRADGAVILTAVRDMDALIARTNAFAGINDTLVSQPVGPAVSVPSDVWQHVCIAALAQDADECHRALAAVSLPDAEISSLVAVLSKPKASGSVALVDPWWQTQSGDASAWLIGDDATWLLYRRGDGDQEYCELQRSTPSCLRAHLRDTLSRMLKSISMPGSKRAGGSDA